MDAPTKLHQKTGYSLSDKSPQLFLLPLVRHWQLVQPTNHKQIKYNPLGPKITGNNFCRRNYLN